MGAAQAEGWLGRVELKIAIRCQKLRLERALQSPSLSESQNDSLRFADLDPAPAARSPAAGAMLLPRRLAATRESIEVACRR